MGIEHSSGCFLQGVQEFVMQWTVFVFAWSRDASFGKLWNLTIEVGKVNDVCV